MEEKNITQEVLSKDRTPYLRLEVPLDEERQSRSKKSIICYSSGMEFTPVPGTHLAYKLIVIRNIESPGIFKEEEDVSTEQTAQE